MDAFEDFYRSRARDVRRYATAIVGGGDADDVCQEAWLRIWRSWGDADPARRDAWAFRIVRNCCIDRHRRARPPVELDEADLPPLPGLDDVVDARVDADDALAMLAGLAPPLREALWLREVAEMTYAEIAEAQGVPIGTVMSRLHSARKKVARRLRAEGRWGVIPRPAHSVLGSTGRAKLQSPTTFSPVTGARRMSRTYGGFVPSCEVSHCPRRPSLDRWPARR